MTRSKAEERIARWITSHPQRPSGYRLIARETRLTPSTARYTLRRLLERGAVTRTGWRAGDQTGFTYAMKETP